MKVKKTPNTLESGGKIDILSSTLICQIPLEFKSCISSEIFPSLNRFQSSLVCAACLFLGIGPELCRKMEGKGVTQQGKEGEEGKKGHFSFT